MIVQADPTAAGLGVATETYERSGAWMPARRPYQNPPASQECRGAA